MLGDEAVAVNPTDPRYQSLIGRRCLLPLQNRQIPVIADEWVDPKFGTGCVKVTPAHDPADYEMAQRHQLPLTVVIGPDGMMTPAAGEDFVGLDRMEAREAVIEQLEAQGLLLKVEPYTHNVGYSERSHVPIEPYLSDQWFLRYPSVDRSTAAVEQGEIRFYPERWVKTYTHWMRNLKDWCISRQLWWGHRIPVWYRKPATSGNHAESGRGSAAIHVDVEPPPDPGNWEQDTDVLDTWFSSWLWPFATMGWPESTPTLRKFYPTTDLVTGPDIIFFWVARMIMAGYEYLGEKPFASVYFTGIIRDKLGRKMSKSLGNSPDPLDLINQFGADALRFGIMRSAPLGQDVLYDELHVALGRNFCNKLWNACRFRQLQGGSPEAEIDPALLTVDDKWLLLKLDRAIREISSAFAEYRFTEVTQTLHRFFWNEYCDWYVEASKAVFQGDDPARKTNTLAVIDFVLSHMLRLFHPFLPFITEELWHGLGYQLDLPQTQGGQTIMSAPWPKPLDEPFKTHYGLDESDERLVDARCALIGRGRNLRREFNIPANRKITFILRPSGAMSPHDLEVLRLLLNADAVNLDPAYAPPQGTPSALSELGELFMPLAGLVDAGAERARLTKELARIQIEIDRVQVKLDNPAFVQKVPPAVLEDHQKRLADAQAKQAQFQTALDALQ
jgi:valyl-tRNA synthetase